MLVHFTLLRRAGKRRERERGGEEKWKEKCDSDILASMDKAITIIINENRASGCGDIAPNCVFNARRLRTYMSVHV